jgi:hypothetical protein
VTNPKIVGVAMSDLEHGRSLLTVARAAALLDCRDRESWCEHLSEVLFRAVATSFQKPVSRRPSAGQGREPYLKMWRHRVLDAMLWKVKHGE